MGKGNAQQAGTSDPLDFRNARAVGAPGTDTLYGGSLGPSNLPGSSYLNNTAVTATIAIAGALKVRLRGKFTKGGVLSFFFLRPAAIRPLDPSAAGYAYDNTLEGPSGDVTISDATEFVVDIANLSGESDLLVSFLPDADGAVDFFDVMQQ